MKVYDITIKPISGFATPLKGDTIFGHFCWQIANDPGLMGATIDEMLSNYGEKPFAIFSSAFPKFCEGANYTYALKTPDLPMDALFDFPGDKREKIAKRKEYKAKKWMILREGGAITSFKEMEYAESARCKKSTSADIEDSKSIFSMAEENATEKTAKLVRRAGVGSFIVSATQSHNTINRLTGTTGEGRFAPYAVEQYVYYPETELALFVGIDEAVIEIEQVLEGLGRIGAFGFGKDASTGLGRFDILKEEAEEVDLSGLGSRSPNACYTLAPSVPEKELFSDMFFSPFTRFGRHGDVLAKSGKPFKSPVIMADEGAVLIPKNGDIFNKPYIGRAVRNVSKAEPNTVVQGYSLYIPVSVEV